MIAKVREREEALLLRAQGHSYNEIQEKVGVAKSTLSLWLRDAPLTKTELEYLKTRLKKRISLGRIRAAAVNHQNRLNKRQEQAKIAQSEFLELQNNSFFLVGVALYWAEGTKRGDSVSFMNSEVRMVHVFINWTKIFFNKEDLDFAFRLYIHKHYANEHCEKYWAKHLQIPVEQIKISFKPDNKQIKKRPNYKGCFRVRVRKSSLLLLKLKVWHNMLSQMYSGID